MLIANHCQLASYIAIASNGSSIAKTFLVNMCLCASRSVHECIFVCMYMCLCVCVCICVCTCDSVYAFLYACVCVCVCMCMWAQFLAICLCSELKCFEHV